VPSRTSLPKIQQCCPEILSGSQIERDGRRTVQPPPRRICARQRFPCLQQIRYCSPRTSSESTITSRPPSEPKVSCTPTATGKASRVVLPTMRLLGVVVGKVPASIGSRRLHSAGLASRLHRGRVALAAWGMGPSPAVSTMEAKSAALGASGRLPTPTVHHSPPRSGRATAHLKQEKKLFHCCHGH